MAEPSRGSDSTRPTWIVVSVLLLIAIVLPLLVGTYDSETPTLFGFPFFYWYQFALVPVASILTFIAFQLSLSATARDRRRRGQSYETDGTDESR